MVGALDKADAGEARERLKTTLNDLELSGGYQNRAGSEQTKHRMDKAEVCVS